MNNSMSAVRYSRDRAAYTYEYNAKHHGFELWHSGLYVLSLLSISYDYIFI